LAGENTFLLGAAEAHHEAHMVVEAADLKTMRKLTAEGRIVG
jgi:hypothetical protein